MGVEKWSRSDIDTAIRVLGRFNPNEFTDAVAEVGRSLGREGVTKDALTNAFKRYGKGGPARHCVGANRTIGDFPRANGDDLCDATLYIPDCHVPHHSRPSVDVMLQVARYVRPKTIVILGDFIDCAEVSFHDRSHHRIAGLKEEIDAGKSLRAELDAIGATRKIAMAGNHEHRLLRYLARNAPALLDVMPSIEHLLEFPQNGWECYAYGQHVQVGKVYVTHDAGHAGITAVRLTKAKYQHNVVLGHVHRGIVEYDGNMLGEKHVGISMGWLGDDSSVVTNYVPQSMKLHSWMNGFGLSFRDPSGNDHVQFVPIINGRAVVHGRCFTAAAAADAKAAA